MVPYMSRAPLFAYYKTILSIRNLSCPGGLEPDHTPHMATVQCGQDPVSNTRTGEQLCCVGETISLCGGVISRGEGGNRVGGHITGGRIGWGSYHGGHTGWGVI